MPQSSANNMKSALKAVRNGMSLRQASLTFGVAKSTLHAHLNKKKVDGIRLEKSGKLCSQDEQRLTSWLVYCNHMGFAPITQTRLREEASHLSRTSGSEKKFNKEWGKYFTQKEGKVLSAMSLYKYCNYFDKKSLEIWFKSLMDFCRERQFPFEDKPQQMFYCSKLHITDNFKLVLSFSATGMATPPLFIAANLKDSEESLDNFDKLVLPRGWIKYNCKNMPYHQDQENIFVYYIEHVLKSYLLQKGIHEPILMFTKNESCPPKLQLYELCCKLKLFWVNSYPTAFKQLDQMLQDEISSGLKDITNKQITSLVELVKRVLMTKLTKSNMAKSFRESGIYPWNLAQVNIDNLPNLQVSCVKNEESDDDDDDDDALESCDIEHIDTGEISPPTIEKYKPRISLDWKEFSLLVGNEVIDKLEKALANSGEENIKSQEFKIILQIYRKFSLDNSQDEMQVCNDVAVDDDPLSGGTNAIADATLDLWE